MKIYLKCLLTLFPAFFLFHCRTMQKTTPIARTECDSLFFDLGTGMINSVSPMLPQGDIKEWFGCYTAIIPEGASTECGGGVIYNKHGFSYYTYFDYVEVRSNFTGKVTGDLLRNSRDSAKSAFGLPVKTKFQELYPEIDFYATSYGCLTFEYSEGKAVKIGAHYNECENVEVCR
jgi:hypothetical protein